MKIMLSEYQRFVKNLTVKIISSVAVFLCNILIISHLSEALTVEGFGRLAFVQTYFSYFSLFISLGMDVAATRAMSMEKDRISELFNSLFTIKWIISIFLFIVMLGLVVIVPKLRTMGILIFLFSLNMLLPPFPFQSVYESTKKMEIPSAINVFNVVINYFLIIIFVKNPDNINFVALISIVLNVITIILHSTYYIKNFGFFKLRIDTTEMKYLLKSGVVIGFIQITVMMIHYADVFLLGFMTDNVHVGLYSAAYKAMFVLINLMGIIHNLMSPLLFENYIKNLAVFERYFKVYFKFMIYFGYGITVIFIILAREYLAVFYNLGNYSESILCFKILMCSIFFMTINSPLHSGLLSAHQEKLLLKIIILQVFINIVSNIIVIPVYGINGAAVTTVITEIFGLYLYILSFKKIININLFYNLLIAILSAIPMALFLLYFQLFHFVITGIVGGGIMVLTAIILRGYTMEEVKDLTMSVFFKK